MILSKILQSIAFFLPLHKIIATFYMLIIIFNLYFQLKDSYSYKSNLLPLSLIMLLIVIKLLKRSKDILVTPVAILSLLFPFRRFLFKGSQLFPSEKTMKYAIGTLKDKQLKQVPLNRKPIGNYLLYWKYKGY